MHTSSMSGFWVIAAQTPYWPPRIFVNTMVSLPPVFYVFCLGYVAFPSYFHLRNSSSQWCASTMPTKKWGIVFQQSQCHILFFKHLGKLHWSQGLSKLNSSIKIQVFQIYTSWYIRWGSKQTRQNPSVWKEEKLPHKVLVAEYYFPSLPKMRTIYKHVCSSWNISTVKYETAASYT